MVIDGKYRFIACRKDPRGVARGIFIVYFLAIFVGAFDTSSVFAKTSKEHEDPTRESGRTINGPGPGNSGGGSVSGCAVNPSDIADFAKGTAFRYSSMVTLLSSPDCIENSRKVSEAALIVGNIKFNEEGPLRLDRFASQLRPDELQSAARVDALVANAFPSLLRENPVSTRDLLPLAGQLALLSPTAARDAWVTLIQQELYAGDDMLANARSEAQRKAAASTIAGSLDKLGIEQPVIARAMAGRIQDMALMVQVDSLSKMFRALGAATTVDGDLIPIYNLSAGSLSRGVKRGDKLFSKLDRLDLLKTVFSAIQASLGVSEELDPAGIDLNEAVAILAKGDATDIKKLTIAWNQALDMLGLTMTQTTLARAVAMSLTPDVIFLSQSAGAKLVAAARNYPVMAFALQGSFLKALHSFDESTASKELSEAAWAQLKKNFLVPMATQLVALGPDRIDPMWLREACAKKLIRDEDIEKRFPRLVLAYLNQREDKMKEVLREPDAESGVTMMTQNLAVLWILSNIHYPALTDWANRFETTQKK